MLPKIGVSKCPHKRIKFFNVSSHLDKIYIANNHPKIDTIISFMVSYKINKISISKEKMYDNEKNSIYSFITAFIELTYKIIYSSKEKKSLHIFNYKSYTMSEIRVPSILDGFSVEQLFNTNKLKVEVFIENVDIELYENCLLVINPYILSNILILNDYSIAYVLELANGDKNIYLSYADGSKLIQKTFSKNYSYKNISWCPFSNEISYISNESGIFELYSLNTNNRGNPKVHSGLSDMTHFCYISKDTLVICSENSNLSELFLLNLRTNNVSKLIKVLDGQSLTMPKYSKNVDKIFFINRTKDSNHLCSIKSNSLDLTYIIEKHYIHQYDINQYGNTILIVYKDAKESPFKASIYEIDTAETKDISLFNCDYTIKGMSFIPFKNQVAFCIAFKDKDDIIIYDYNLDYIKNLTNHATGIFISDFTFNFLGDTLYFSSNERGHYDVYSLSLENLDKKTLVNCSCNDVSLYYKGL